MKKTFIYLATTLLFTSCTPRCNPNYEDRSEGLRKALPNGVYVRSESLDLAIDTSQQPNKIYKIVWCTGVTYSASTVDCLIKVY